LAFVLSTVAGHLFGYECALAIDSLARPLREARAAIERCARQSHDGEELLHTLAPDLAVAAESFFEALRDRILDGSLEASTAARLGSLFRYATGVVPLHSYQLEYGRVGTPALVLDDLTAALTRAIAELTRPIDAIKHQAKTVTVGISRSDEALLTERLVQEVLAAGASRDRLGYADLRALAALGSAVEKVVGYSRYEIDGEEATATIRQVGSGGVASALGSRTRTNPALRGTKHQVARERQLLVALGRSDGRTVLIVPEVRDNRTTGITLLHLVLRERLAENEARTALSAYRNRFSRLRDAVTETEPELRTDLLTTIPVVRLLTAPVTELADAWRGTGSAANGSARDMTTRPG
jgi:glucosamine--fructose-6-phosphate aminotransferase (isomerizing)